MDTDSAATAETADEVTDEPKRSPGEQAAEDRELRRQKAVVDAVAKANDNELPKLGGPLKEPGLGR